MVARLRSWWKQIKQHRLTILVVTIILVVAVALILIGYRYDWTGFNGNNKSDKTLWDWMQLLFIPVVLAVAGFWFNHRERKAAEKRAEIEQNAAERRAEAERENESRLLRLKTVRLTPNESRLLRVLAAHANTVCTPFQISILVYSRFLSSGYASLIKMAIRHLQQKIEPDPMHPIYLLTVPGEGYKLVIPDSGKPFPRERQMDHDL